MSIDTGKKTTEFWFVLLNSYASYSHYPGFVGEDGLEDKLLENL
jgi:hypothetical protein